jgi:hypothetical protein
MKKSDNVDCRGGKTGEKMKEEEKRKKGQTAKCPARARTRVDPR